ncbi:MAG: trypsin-like serine protease [Desulfobulbaceae bacterium]|nr:trypsin-like serine protease [Desulfobulbaceae bacterium]
MKLCHKCGQALAEPIKNCPSCGQEVADGLKYVDDYRIVDVVYEGRASIVCRAIKEPDDTQAALRLFTSTSGVDETVAQRLKVELEELQKLPEDWFVRHDAIRCSSEGKWYRVSEWLDVESWGDLFSSGKLRNLDVAYDLFLRIAAILDGLHKSGHIIPHLILNDILILKGVHGRVDVKIDYKLSRFLDPKMARPGPLLQKLLDCHPDIQKGRPLNFKSDVWSLGRIFTQILAADLDLGNPVSAAKTRAFPKEIAILIGSMLADDPDLRPRSMSEVADALQRIKAEHYSNKKPPRAGTVGEIKKLKKKILVIGIIIGIMAAVGGVFLFQFKRDPTGLETAFAGYADLYADSVAFVAVQYQIKVDDEVLYGRRTEGTAFLVDSEGYLLTNRHVSCPWLEDDRLYRVINYIKSEGKNPEFGYQIYLWFEGETAFNRLYGIGDSGDVEDVYDLVSAYTRQGSLAVEIAGVARAPAGRGQLVKSPLRDDFAVLKISPVPAELHPLPLDKEINISGLKRLSPVMALGFPLGRSSQEDVINVSVTRGHVRRTFENFFQVDTSIYKGNSGGPIIDERGEVIGIVSAVATDLAVAPMPVITPLSDIGLVLPVTKAAVFIDELKDGQPKWNGVLDLSAAEKIKEITDAAFAGKWSEAKELADQTLKYSRDPSLVFTAAMIHYCIGDFGGSSQLFDRVLSIDSDNHHARLMRYMIDLRDDARAQISHPMELLAMDWHSPGEFFGHLAKMIQKGEEGSAALGGWNSPVEKGWVYYVAGLIQLERENTAKARSLFEAAARISMKDDWPLFLALSELDHLSKAEGNDQSELILFLEQLQGLAEKRKTMLEKTMRLMAQFKESAADPEKRRVKLLELYTLDPENKKLIAFAAYYDAIASEWQQALQTAEKYLQLSGREESLRLGTMLLVPGILLHLGKEEEAREQLHKIHKQINAPWHRQICSTLLNEQSEKELIDNAGNIPEKILTAYTALGFRAEARGDHGLAIKYYREALGSYLDNWAEYELARHRYIKLRQK